MVSATAMRLTKHTRYQIRCLRTSDSFASYTAYLNGHNQESEPLFLIGLQYLGRRTLP